MADLLTVQPAGPVRRAFARWAVAQTPKLRTVSAEAFGVPPHLFAEIPEALLQGATVNGYPYEPAEEATEAAPAGAPELLGVATVDGFPLAPPVFAPLEDAEPFEPGGLVIVGEDGPETVVPLGDRAGDTGDNVGDTAGDREDTVPAAPAVSSGDTGDKPGDTAGDKPGDSDRSDPPADKPHPCDRCPKSFETERGRDTHRRMVHGR
jgi:hypothetical protein